jgi:signal transduction histidine kinase
MGGHSDDDFAGQGIRIVGGLGKPYNGLMNLLPPLRQRIFRSYFFMVAVYGLAMAVLLGTALFVVSGISPKIIYRNYDSIQACQRMGEAWNALYHPSEFPQQGPASWRRRFQAALDFEKSNITEPGEAQIAGQLDALWGEFQSRGPSARLREAVEEHLASLIKVNEEGMQRLAAQALQQGRRIFSYLAIFFVLSLGLTLLIANRLAFRLSDPLIQISQTLRREPSMDEALVLPRPNSQELEVLVRQLGQWWEQIRANQRMMLLEREETERRRRERLENEFIGVLSHELKTPLQSMGISAELLAAKKDKMDPSLHLFVDTILEDLGRIRAVANDFVQVSQLNVRSIRLKLEPVRLQAKLKEWIRPFEVLAREKGVALSFEGEAGEGMDCVIDPVKFSWVVSNLLSNAVRVSVAGQTIRVQLADQKLYTELSVLDQGPGIEAALQRRMFEPYVQGEGPEKEKTSGLLGLGLTIAKEIVEAHEGVIEYFPAQGGGSVFRVLLPFMPGALKQARAA